MSWPLGEAKNRFSELVDLALAEGPQEVTRHGRPVVFVVAAEEWRLRRAGFKEALQSLDLDGIEVERSRDPGRAPLVEDTG